jgi:hypothetical protein
MGWDGMGWDGTGYQKCPSIFFILSGYIGKVYIYLYLYSKFVTNTLMGLKIQFQVEELEYVFKNSPTYTNFENILQLLNLKLNFQTHKSVGDKFRINI